MKEIEELLGKFSNMCTCEECSGAKAEILKRFEELKTEVKRLGDRDGNAKIFLLIPTKNRPFDRISIKVVDFGVFENHYICESEEIEQKVH